jgi:hypothetical protein
METTSIKSPSENFLHPWLRSINLACIPGQVSPLLEEFIDTLFEHFRQHGHTVQEVPDDSTDVLLTTAPFGQALNWRHAPLFNARLRFGLKHTPIILTLMQITPEELESQLKHFERALSKPEPDPEDYRFPGLVENAHHTLVEQGRRGGPILALERVLQIQAKSIRILLVVGNEHPLYAYHFDMVGAYPRSDAGDPEAFYDDIVHRVATVASTHEVTDHLVLDELILRSQWNQLETPQALRLAGQELGRRNFFTEMVLVDRLVHVPAINDAVASQYSEGCFSSWEPQLNGLMATVTGSSRPVDKTDVTENDLAVIVGVREDGKGAIVRHIEEHRNDPPSSEAVEMFDMDALLPRVRWEDYNVPVARSKLHGHRGISAYDPDLVEFVLLDPAYYHYPVSCATEAQAHAIKSAFSRSQALQDPDDPRQIAFTILPGHGVVITEKWVSGKAPLQIIWEAMDSGALEVSAPIPQGPFTYVTGGDGRMVVKDMD